MITKIKIKELGIELDLTPILQRIQILENKLTTLQPANLTSSNNCNNEEIKK